MSDDFLRLQWTGLTCMLPGVKKQLYDELVSLYSSPDRHYHTLEHISSMLRLASRYENKLTSPDTVNFAIWYHDAIYIPTQNDNEEKSAEMAADRLKQLNAPQELINNCYRLIIATKTHTLTPETNSFDARFLLDIDLNVLAGERTAYNEYAKQIRKEYHMYDDQLYTSGRRKVLKHFLEMPNIYKTELFQEIWEEKAKANLRFELSQL